MVTKLIRRNKIRARIRSKVSGIAAKPRLSVFRSNKEIYAQLIDDVSGKTLISASSKEETILKTSGTKVEKSKAVGALLAQKATAAGISAATFDRGGYLYHGRVKALADGAREGGLKF